MAVQDYFILRGGFIPGDIVRWRDPTWPKGKKKEYTGQGFGGQQTARMGRRLIAAEVIEGPDEDGWMVLLVRSYDNHGMTPLDEIFMAPPVKKQIRRKYTTIMRGEPERLAWENERLRAELVSEVWGKKRHPHFMTLDEDEDEVR